MKVAKSYEITDAKISFVSLVDKAANKKQFLITKAEKGTANFTTYGRILKVDTQHHYVTGIVYEPMAEDSHGNFMTEEEIIKAAYWFAKNGDKIDLQHSFEKLSDAFVVETWVNKSDTVIEGEEIKKGTWLLTVEISDPDVWDQIQKGELTGFSMGGVGKYSDQDVDIAGIEKGGQSSMRDKNTAGQADAQKEQKGIFKKLAEMFGLDVVEKGAMLDNYSASIKSTRFWTAFYTLEDLLYRYNWTTDRWEYEKDERVIKEALEEFSAIITEVLTEQSIIKALATDKPVRKAGKKMSAANKTKLDEIAQSLADFSAQFNEEEDESVEKNAKEETEVKPEDIQKMIQDEIKKALETAAPAPAPAAPVVKAEDTKEKAPAAPLTKEDVAFIIAAEIKKALADEESGEENDEAPLTKEDVAEVVRKELAAVLKAKGVASNLNDTGQVQKSEQHYLHGIL